MLCGVGGCWLAFAFLPFFAAPLLPSPLPPPDQVFFTHTPQVLDVALGLVAYRRNSRITIPEARRRLEAIAVPQVSL